MPNYYAIIPASVRYDKELTDKAKLLYGEITALSNEKGFCWATNAYFADLYSCHETTISRLIAQLEKKKYITTKLVKEGYKTRRRIYLVENNENSLSKNDEVDLIKNDEVEHSKNDEVDLSIFAKVEHSKNDKQNNTINNTTNNTLSNKSKKINKKRKTVMVDDGVEQEFLSFWDMYPFKKGSKAKALKSFTTARKKKKATYEDIINGLKRYIEYLNINCTEQEFIAHGSTWLNQERWQDLYITQSAKKKARNPLELYRQEFGGFDNEQTGSARACNTYSSSLQELLQGNNV